MKALVLERDKVLSYTDVPLAEKPGPEWVLVRIAYAGICNSDLRRGFGGGAYHYPLIMGHELSGVVEEGPPGGGFSAGDRVTVYPLLPCGRCPACRAGAFAQCSDYDYFGSRRDGGFAEYLYVPERNLVPVPDRVTLLHAALSEPCAVALHAVGRLRIEPGSSAAVIGFGPIGAMAAQWLKIRGCKRIFAVDVEEQALELARSLGFTPVASLLEATGGQGVDCAVVACGVPAAFGQAIQAAARFGQVLFLGNIHGQFVLPEKEFSSILRRELGLLGSWNSLIVPGGGGEWSTALEYMDDGLEIEPLIGRLAPLAEGPELFARLAEGSLKPHGRVVFAVGREDR